MNKFLPVILVSFFVGGAVGIGINEIRNAHSSDLEATDGAEQLQPSENHDALSDLEAENEALKAKLDQLQEELEQLSKAQTEQLEVLMEAESAEPSEAELRKWKKAWLEEMLQAPDDSRFGRRSEKELSRLIQSLGLTPEQATEVALLMDKRDQQRKLMMMRTMGLISEEEYNTMFAELSTFDFELAMNSLLSPEQQAGLESMQSDQQARGSERVTQMMANRLNLNDNERFSESERSAISDAIKSAMDRTAEIEIPPAIKELDINRMDKRILAAGYEQLDSEAFEKLYQSVVEENENGGEVFIMGGGRPPPPPGG